MNKNWLPGLASLIMISLVILSFVKKSEPSSQKVSKIKTIIVDAGHGFRCENGCRHGSFGTETSEDGVTYAVAKKVVEEIQKEMPDVKVLESRPTTRFVENKARAEFANNNKGDLFVSIHCNFAPKLREVRREGSRKETYYVYTGKGKKSRH